MVFVNDRFGDYPNYIYNPIVFLSGDSGTIEVYNVVEDGGSDILISDDTGNVSNSGIESPADFADTLMGWFDDHFSGVTYISQGTYPAIISSVNVQYKAG